MSASQQHHITCCLFFPCSDLFWKQIICLTIGLFLRSTDLLLQTTESEHDLQDPGMNGLVGIIIPNIMEQYEKYESQLGLLFPILWKNKIHVLNHQADQSIGSHWPNGFCNGHHFYKSRLTLPQKISGDHTVVYQVVAPTLDNPHQL